MLALPVSVTAAAVPVYTLAPDIRQFCVLLVCPVGQVRGRLAVPRRLTLTWRGIRLERPGTDLVRAKDSSRPDPLRVTCLSCGFVDADLPDSR